MRGGSERCETRDVLVSRWSWVRVCVSGVALL